MKELIERLRKATGRSIELDEAIRALVGAESINYGPAEGCVTTDECYGPPNYTGSIDAAWTLWPDGWARGVSLDPGHNAHAWGDVWGEHHVGAYGATPAIALCIATLEARTIESTDRTPPTGSAPKDTPIKEAL